jgi:hypothetical protein
MAAIASPYGLKPLQLIGSQFNNTSAVREYLMFTNSANPIFNGDLVQITGGNIAAYATTSPVVATTFGIVGVCVGVRYVDPTMKYFINAQFLPANAVTNGYTQIYIKVYEDPDALFLIQGNAQISATLNTALASIGKNAAIAYSAGSTVTGNSANTLTVGTIAVTATLALRIVDFYWGQSSAANNPAGNSSATDLFPDIIVKFNQGLHAYYASTGL